MKTTGNKIAKTAVSVSLTLVVCAMVLAIFSPAVRAAAAAEKSAATAVKAAAVKPLALTAVDPGVRQGAAGAGGFLKGMTTDQIGVLPQLTTEINNVISVPSDGTFGGLGPRFNSNSCASCHAQPALGGSSPASNPLFGVYQLMGALNTMPSFITTTGPVLEARFINMPDGVTPDGNVHQLFTIKGRTDGGACGITQPDFATAISTANIGFRQPLPTFGDGEIEIIQNSDLIANLNANLTAKQALGIAGRPNYSGNDGSILRFGWKAQIRSVHIFTAQQYSTEMGVTNETFQTETDDTVGCVLNVLPENATNFTPGIPVANFPGAPERTAEYITFLAGPTPGPSSPSVRNGSTQFNNIGCNLCHTQSFKTPASSLGGNITGNKTINIYSDILLHHMGPGLADGIAQGGAGPDEFRTPPLWGVGQRIWFMHDARTKDIGQAIEAHNSLANSKYPASEANAVVTSFNNLSSTNQQDLINFLRSL